MKKLWTTAFALFALAGCCMTGGGAAVAPGVPAAPPAGAVAYTADPAIPTWSSGYAATMMQDNNPSTYWCTPMGPVFPIVTTITLAAPSNVVDVDFDTRLPGYDTSAIRDVMIEPLGAGGMPIGAPVSAGLLQNNVTSVPVVGMGATAIRFTFFSNFGGTYAGLSELTVRTTPGTGLPPLPSMGGLPSLPPSMPSIPTMPSGPAGPGIAFVVDPMIPTWSSGYAATMMQDMNLSTYWCSPSGAPFPIVTTLTLPMPSTVTGLAFNTAISGYDNIGPRDVTIEALDPMGNVVGMTNGVVLQNTSSTVMLPMPVLAGSVRLTMRSNYGGSYTGIAELSVMGIGLPPLPGT